jgi:hypothetical protein
MKQVADPTELQHMMQAAAEPFDQPWDQPKVLDDVYGVTLLRGIDPVF